MPSGLARAFGSNDASERCGRRSMLGEMYGEAIGSVGGKSRCQSTGLVWRCRLHMRYTAPTR